MSRYLRFTIQLANPSAALMSSMRPTPKMMRLNRELTRLWGEPSESVAFDARDLDHPVHLQIIDVPIWLSDDHCEVTALNTLGMSEKRMKDAAYFAELHIAYRGTLVREQRRSLAALLANLAEYPFEHDLTLDHWHVINNPGRVPVFSACRHLLLHPKFTDEGLDELADPDGLVKIFYVTPITSHERHLLVGHGRETFQDYIFERGVDLLSDRGESS